MIKVSFKDKKNYSAKTVEIFNGKETIVTLRGEMRLPKFLGTFPRHIWNWINQHQSVDSYQSIVTDNMVIIVGGTSRCNDEDTFNPIIGERIAESRAKIKLYKFVYTLLYKLHVYYFSIAFGDRYALCDVSKVADYDKPGGIFEEMGKYKDLLDKETIHLEKLLKET